MPIAYQCRGCKGPPLPQPWPHKRCPHCRRWYDYRQINADIPGAEEAAPIDGDVISFQDAINYAPDEAPRIETGIEGVDYVLAGGLVPGTLVLFTGDPGVGKTTLLLQVLQSLAKQRRTVLYVSGEESIAQLGQRAKKFGKFPPRMQAVHVKDIDEILDRVDDVKPDVVVVDSVQIVVCTNGSGEELEPGSSASVKCAIREFMAFAQQHKIVFIVIGHVTKDGAIGGPRALVHYIDVGIHFSGRPKGVDRRLGCPAKNRFGSTPRSAKFKMTEEGLVSTSKFVTNEAGFLKPVDEDEDENDGSPDDDGDETPEEKKSKAKKPADKKPDGKKGGVVIGTIGPKKKKD